MLMFYRDSVDVVVMTGDTGTCTASKYFGFLVHHRNAMRPLWCNMDVVGQTVVMVLLSFVRGWGNDLVATMFVVGEILRDGVGDRRERHPHQ